MQGSLYIIPSDYPFPFRTLVRLVTSGSLRDPRRRVARTSGTEDASERRAKLLSFFLSLRLIFRAILETTTRSLKRPKGKGEASSSFAGNCRKYCSKSARSKLAEFVRHLLSFIFRILRGEISKYREKLVTTLGKWGSRYNDRIWSVNIASLSDRSYFSTLRRVETVGY